MNKVPGLKDLAYWGLDDGETYSKQTCKIYMEEIK